MRVRQPQRSTATRTGYQFSCGFSWEIQTRNGRNAEPTSATGKKQWGFPARPGSLSCVVCCLCVAAFLKYFLTSRCGHCDAMRRHSSVSSDNLAGCAFGSVKTVFSCNRRVPSLLGKSQDLQGLNNKWRDEDDLTSVIWHNCMLHQEAVVSLTASPKMV